MSPKPSGSGAGRTVYRPGVMERLGPWSYQALRALAWSLPLALMAAAVCLWHLLATGWGLMPAVILALLAAALVSSLVTASVTLAGHWAGVGVGRALWPSGGSTPRIQEFSLEMARVARGDLAGGLALLERRIEMAPRDPQPRIAAADLYALKARDPFRARRHFEAVLAIPDAPPREKRYAASRLVDLYLGPLATHPASARRLREIDLLYPALIPEGSLPPDPAD